MRASEKPVDGFSLFHSNCRMLSNIVIEAILGTAEAPLCDRKKQLFDELLIRIMNTYFWSWFAKGETIFFLMYL